jgi:hypothetical protein
VVPPWRLTFAPAGLVRGCWLPGLAAGRCGPSCRSRLMRAARAGDGQLAAVLRANVGLLLWRLRQVHGEGELTLPESSALVRLERGGPAMPSALARLEQISPQSMGRPVRLPGRQWAVGGFSEVLAKEVGPPALGDPAKVAQVVLTVADMDNPPLRLILGSEAYAYAAAAAQARAEADAKWHDLSVSTDRDDATAADRDPLGTRSG